MNVRCARPGIQPFIGHVIVQLIKDNVNSKADPLP